MTVIVIASLAALWGWFVLQFENPPFLIRKIKQGLTRLGGEKLVKCPWCIGAWFSITGCVALGDFNPVHWLASAGLTGFLAFHLHDDGEPDE